MTKHEIKVGQPEKAFLKRASLEALKYPLAAVSEGNSATGHFLGVLTSDALQDSRSFV
jgi:hypothetical protein